jgi:hypothetical protein
MRISLIFALLLILPVAMSVGCKDEPAGGPGADVRTDDDRSPENDEATFTASLGEDAIELAAGSQEEIDLTIDRGDEFEQTVVATFQAPKGLTITPDKVDYTSGQEDAKITVQAAADAPVGQELSIQVTFQPETGKSLMKQLKVTVTEPERDDDPLRDN